MVGKVVVDLVSEVVIDWVVMLLVVPLMRLPYHLSIPHHLSRLLYHTSIPYHPPILSYHPYSSPPLKTSPLHVIPPLSPTSLALEATLPSTTLPTTLPPINETMIDFVPDLGACPLRRPYAPRPSRVVPPSTPSAPSAPLTPSVSSYPFDIAHAPTDHLAMYYRHLKRNTKPPSCGTH